MPPGVIFWTFIAELALWQASLLWALVPTLAIDFTTCSHNWMFVLERLPFGPSKPAADQPITGTVAVDWPLVAASEQPSIVTRSKVPQPLCPHSPPGTSWAHLLGISLSGWGEEGYTFSPYSHLSYVSNQQPTPVGQGENYCNHFIQPSPANTIPFLTTPSALPRRAL